MSPIVADAFALLLAGGGFATLMLAMPRHHQDWLGRSLRPGRARAGRLAGFVLLALSVLSACVGHGWSYGLVAICGWWTLAAAFVVAANCNRQRILDRFGRGRR